MRYRVRFTVKKGKVVDFVVQLEWHAGKQWVPLIRYDTVHGFAHRDRYEASNVVSKHELLPYSDYNKALTFAIKDVQTNWKKWLREYGSASDE